MNQLLQLHRKAKTVGERCGDLAIKVLLVSILGLCAFAEKAQSQNAEQKPQLMLPRVQLTVGKKQISVQLAQTAAEREIGLMFRAVMDDDDGMLFDFRTSSRQCFWMRNTLLPLTAAFVNASGKVVNLANMQPLTTEAHCSVGEVRYVLEMRQGWFARHGVRPGAQVLISAQK